MLSERNKEKKAMRRLRKNKIQRQRHKAQNLVELALLMPILGYCFLGLIDLGRAMYVYIALHDAAANTAVYAGWNHSGGTINTSDLDQEAIVELTGDGMINDNSTYIPTSGITVQDDSYDATTGADSVTSTTGGSIAVKQGDNLTVTLTYNFTLITPFISQMNGGSSTLQIKATSSSQVIGSN